MGLLVFSIGAIGILYWGYWYALLGLLVEIGSGHPLDLIRYKFP